MNVLIKQAQLIDLLLQVQKFSGLVPDEVVEAAQALNRVLPLIVHDSYEIAKVFNTPTHQVVMLKSFEEEAVQREFSHDEDDEDFEDLTVDYDTKYQIKQIMFHDGVRIARSFNYDDEAKRDEVWAIMSQDHAQKFVDATVDLITKASTENDEDPG